MSDDLVKRLRHRVPEPGRPYKSDATVLVNPQGDEAADLIAALEADRDAAATAALREAADVAGRFYAKGQVTKPEDILALLPDAGAALDRALAAELERCAKVADSYNEDPYPQTEYDRGWARSAQVIAAAIRAQKENP